MSEIPAPYCELRDKDSGKEVLSKVCPMDLLQQYQKLRQSIGVTFSESTEGTNRGTFTKYAMTTTVAWSSPQTMSWVRALIKNGLI